jgi:ABC-type Na+ efflux pump permease subunit
MLPHDTTSSSSKLVRDFYERSQHEPVSPFDAEYDDIPWSTRVEMASNTEWLERSRKQQTHNEQAKDDTDSELLPISWGDVSDGAIVIAGLSCIGLFVYGILYIAVTTIFSDAHHFEKLMMVVMVIVTAALIVAGAAKLIEESGKGDDKNER